VALQRVLANDEEDLIAPPGVVPGVDVEEDVDEAPDVLHADGLGVQVDEGGGFMGQDGVMKCGAAGVDGDGVLLLLCVGIGVGGALGGEGLFPGRTGEGVAGALGSSITLLRSGGGLLLRGLGPG